SFGKSSKDKEIGRELRCSVDFNLEHPCDSRPFLYAWYAAAHQKEQPMRFVIAISFAVSIFVPVLSAAPVSGETVYQQRCAACHDSGRGRVRARDELKKFSVARILRAMDFGVMNNIASKLRQEEREAVAAYLGVPGDAGLPPATAYCSDRSVKLTGRAKAQ